MHQVDFTYETGSVQYHNVTLRELELILGWYNDPADEKFYYYSKEGDTEKMMELSGKHKIKDLQVKYV